MKSGNKFTGLWGALFITIIFLSLAVPNAQAWWNEDWKYRKKIALDTSTSGADIHQNLMGFTVLVRLHSGNFDFTAGEGERG